MPDCGFTTSPYVGWDINQISSVHHRLHHISTKQTADPLHLHMLDYRSTTSPYAGLWIAGLWISRHQRISTCQIVDPLPSPYAGLCIDHISRLHHISTRQIVDPPHLHMLDCGSTTALYAGLWISRLHHISTYKNVDPPHLHMMDSVSTTSPGSTTFPHARLWIHHISICWIEYLPHFQAPPQLHVLDCGSPGAITAPHVRLWIHHIPICSIENQPHLQAPPHLHMLNFISPGSITAPHARLWIHHIYTCWLVYQPHLHAPSHLHTPDCVYACWIVYQPNLLSLLKAIQKNKNNNNNNS